LAQRVLAGLIPPWALGVEEIGSLVHADDATNVYTTPRARFFHFGRTEPHRLSRRM